MKRARKNTGTTGTLGNMELEVADKYRYLVQIIKHKGNLMGHLKMVKGKQKQLTRGYSQQQAAQHSMT